MNEIWADLAIDRKLDYAETRHQDDYWPDMFPDRPPDWALEDRRISAGVAEWLSIRWLSIYMQFEGWMLPLFHPDSHALIGWQEKDRAKGGQAITKPGTPRSKTLFGIDVFADDDNSTAILVESPLDVAVLATAGFPGGLATLGTGVSHWQLRILADVSSVIVLALDNDDAGRKARDKIVRSPELAGKTLLDFNYSVASRAKDPGDLDSDQIHRALRTARKVPNSAKNWSVTR